MSNSSQLIQQNSKKIYLVDVSSMFFRAFYAIRPLTSSQGVPVNAVYGFISMIIKLIKEKQPEYMLFCYDRKEPSFRKDIYQDYKANRTEMPEDLQVQMPYLKKVAELFGIADLEVPGYEADDLIGTVAKLAEKNDFDVFIVSGDKDFSQLVSDRVFLYDTMKEFIYTPQAVKEKHGVWPVDFIDYLAITGDTSDHVPGVAGIGPKGAQKLIETYKNLENIYENIDKITPAGVQQKLLTSKENAFLSKKLVTIVTDVEINKSLEEFKIQNFKTEELRDFLRDLNFKSFEKTLLGDGQVSLESLQVKSQLKPGSELNSTGLNIETASGLTEGNNTNYENKIIEVRESSSVINPIEIAWLNQVTFSELVLEKQDLLSLLKLGQFFCFSIKDHFIFIIGQNKYLKINESQLIEYLQELGSLKWSGYDLKNIWRQLKLLPPQVEKYSVEHDLMISSYCLKAQDFSDYLTLIEKICDIAIEVKGLSIDEIILKVVPYLNYLNQKMLVELDNQKLLTIYEKIEKPLIKVLFCMEFEGIKLDIESLSKFSNELGLQIKECEEKVFELSGEKFNLASPKQLGVVLFEKMNLPVVKKTKTGYSTDNEVLEKIEHPISKQLIEFRELTKLKSTYVDSLPNQVDIEDRIHTHFNQALTTTGRLSSTDPNLQNIPIKTERGQRVRKSFIASENKKLLSIDYSQIELRILAHISEDAGLIKAFNEDLDIHAATAAEVFSVALSEVTKEQRRIAKAVNFGIAYGQGAFGLAETLGISRTESKDIIDRYFKKFAGIKDYINSTIEKANETKSVVTLFGRIRHINELKSSNAMIKKFGERAAINAPIQGTAADIVKMAMIDVNRYLINNQSEVKLLLQVHDELIFEGSEELLQESQTSIVPIMENVIRLKVPLKVNAAIGLNWDEAH